MKTIKTLLFHLKGIYGKSFMLLFLFILISLASLQAQITVKFNLTDADVGMGERNDWYTSQSRDGESFYVGLNNQGFGNSIYRGYIEFNLSTIPNNAEILSASLDIYCSGTTGDNFEKGTIIFKNLDMRQGQFLDERDWDNLNPTGTGSVFSSKEIISGNSLKISDESLINKINNVLKNDKYLYFSLINSAENTNGLKFSLNPNNQWLSITYKTPIPLAPSNLRTTQISSNSCVLAWNTSVGAVGYKIYRNGQQIATTASSSYTATGLVPNTTYSFSVSAYNSNGDSEQNPVINLKTLPLKPLPPSNLTYNSLTCTGVSLSWNIPQDGLVSEYKLYINGAFKQNVTANSITLNDLNPNTSYAFEVSAYNDGGESDKSQTLNVSTRQQPTKLPYVYISRKVGPQCTVSWPLLPGQIEGYYVYLMDGRGGHISKVPTTSTSFTFTGPGVFKISISRYDHLCESEKSTPITINLSIPSIPSNLIVSNALGNNCYLSWDKSNNATGYKIFRNGVQIMTTTNTVMTANLLTGSNSFAVSAYNNIGESNKSNTVTINTFPTTPPSTPTNFRITSLNSNSITLAWDSPSTYISGYYVYIYGGRNSLIAKIPTTSTTRTFSGLNGQSCFGVSAYNNIGESHRSALICWTFSYGGRMSFSEEVNENEYLVSNSIIEVYPNPVKDHLFINGLQIFNFELFDLRGKRILEGKNVNTSIDLTDIKPGIYIIELYTSESIITKKIIKY